MARNNTESVVLDTNIVVSAYLNQGTAYEVIQALLKHKIPIVTSRDLLEESSRVFGTKFHRPAIDIESFHRHLYLPQHIVNPINRIDVQKDEPDNRVLEAAVAGHCSFIITGDKELLQLGHYEFIQIVSPRQFLDQLERH